MCVRGEVGRSITCQAPLSAWGATPGGQARESVLLGVRVRLCVCVCSAYYVLNKYVCKRGSGEGALTPIILFLQGGP